MLTDVQVDSENTIHSMRRHSEPTKAEILLPARGLRPMETHSGETTLASKATWSMISSGCSFVGRLAVQVIIARHLGAVGLGELAYCLWLLEIGLLLSSFGMNASITRYMAEMIGEGERSTALAFARRVFFVSLGLQTTAGSVTIVVFTICDCGGSLARVAIPLSALFLIRGIEDTVSAYLAGRQEFRRLARLNMVSMAVLLSVAFVGARNQSVMQILAAYIASSAVFGFGVLDILQDGRSPVPIEWGFWRRFCSYAIQLWFSLLLAAFVWSRIGVFFLERYHNEHAVGIFASAVLFSHLIRQMGMMLSGSFVAHFSQLKGGMQVDEIKRQYHSATRLLALLIIPCIFGLAAALPALMPCVLGDEFREAVPYAIVLVVGAVITVTLVGSAVLQAFERSRIILLSGVAAAAVSLLLSYLIIPHYAVAGAVACRIVSQWTLTGIIVSHLILHLEVGFPLWSVAKTFAAASLAAVVAFSLSRLLGGGWYSLAVVPVVYTPIYAVLIRQFRAVSEQETRALIRLCDRLPAFCRYASVATFRWIGGDAATAT